MNTRLQVVRRYCCPTTRALLFAKFDHKNRTDRHTTLFPFGLRPGWTWSEEIEICSESFEDYNILNIWIKNGFQISGSSVLLRSLTKVDRNCSQTLRKLKREPWRQSAILHLIKINMDNRIEVTALNSLFCSCLLRMEGVFVKTWRKKKSPGARWLTQAEIEVNRKNFYPIR